MNLPSPASKQLHNLKFPNLSIRQVQFDKLTGLAQDGLHLLEIYVEMGKRCVEDLWRDGLELLAEVYAVVQDGVFELGY